MLTVRELAELVGGAVTGDGGVEIHQVAQASCVRSGEITYAISPVYVEMVRASAASAVFVHEKQDLKIPQILVPDPKIAAIQAAMRFGPEPSYAPGISPGAFVHPGAKVDPSASVLPGASVSRGATVGARTVLMSGVSVGENAVVGEDARIHPNVAIGERCAIGNRVILHPGVCIGADGFGFYPAGGTHQKIPQRGIVEVGDDVEIGANSCIDRATVGRTVIGDGTKIDNLVQVGHNCIIGKNCILVSQVGLAGSVRIGDGAILAARAGVADNLNIGAGSIVAGMSGVANDLPAGSRVGGLPAYHHMDWKRNLVHMKNLHRIVRHLEQLAKRVSEIEKTLLQKD
jgi:UDP-3-O-[3-hydroxymyristoyl] glucosamine N-acyltransferase